MAFYSDLNYLKPNKGQLLYSQDAIWQAIYSLLGTKPGTRLFRPTWGGNLSKYLFEPCDEMTARSMMYDITQSLQDEPRATLDTANSYITPDPTNYQFLIQLKFDIPDVDDSESTLNLTFKQKES